MFHWLKLNHASIYKLTTGKVIAIETTGPSSGVEGGAAPHEPLGLCEEEVMT